MGEQGSLFGKLVALGSLVDYQKDAIVSRTLLRNPSGHIVLFAFDAGQELSEHTSPYEVMVLAVEGGSRLHFGGQGLSDESGRHALDATQRTSRPQNPDSVQNVARHASFWG
jgi:hypothetical protein